MWGDAEPNERRLQIRERRGPLAEPSDRFRIFRRIGTEHLLVHHAAHARLAHGLHDDPRLAGVAVGRDAGANALLQPVARRVEHGVAVEDVAAGAGESQDPPPEFQILEEAAHGCELEVAVRVDQSRHQQGISKLLIVARRRVARRSDIRDAIAANRDHAMGDRRLGDRDDPPRVVANHLKA